MTIEQPGYGIAQLQPDNKNPLLKTHFQFQLKKIPTVSYLCQTANIPGVNITAIDQVTLFNQIKRPGGAIQHEDFSIRFIVDEKLKNWQEIFTWMKECSNYTDFAEYKTPEEHLISEGTLFILDNLNQPRYKVTFMNMFPVRLSGIAFDSTNPGSEPQYADVSFVYTAFEIFTL